MPNWCNNYLTITGDEKQISFLSRIINGIKDKRDKNLFMNLVGISPDISKEEYENGKWYTENINGWGTKWDVSVEDSNVDCNSGCITMNMSTAWSPPFGFITKLCEMYKVEAELFYDEIGCDFYGKSTFNPEGLVEDLEYSYLRGAYELDKEQFWMEITSHIESTEEDTTYDDFIKDMELNYLTEEELKEVKEMYDEYKETNSI